MPLSVIDGDTAHSDIPFTAAKVEPVPYVTLSCDLQEVVVDRADGAHHSLVGVSGPDAEGDGQVPLSRPLWGVGGEAVAREAHGVDGAALFPAAGGNVHTALWSSHALGAVARVALDR